MTSQPVYVDQHAFSSSSSALPANTEKLTLYTNHGCPWAHRAHVALHALQVPYWEVIIDLGQPRTAEYLGVNPRGLVPALDVGGGQVVTESAVVAQYLADRFAGLEGESRSAPLERARVNFFVDAFVTKVLPHLSGSMYAASEAEREEKAAKLVEAAAKELEPLLHNAKPFFNGSATLTLAEVQTGSFLLRLVDFPKHGLLPKDLPARLEQKTPAFWKWASVVVQQDSVNYIWDAPGIAERTQERLAKRAKAEAEAKAKA